MAAEDDIRESLTTRRAKSLALLASWTACKPATTTRNEDTWNS